MPGLNGIGPQGTGPISGRGFGRCRTVATPAHKPAAPVQQANAGGEPAMLQDSVQNISVYGCGRGGIPCGCGHGAGFGGGRRVRG